MSPTYIPAFTLVPEKKQPAHVPPDGFRTPSFIRDVAAGKVELPAIPKIVHQLIAQVRNPVIDTRRISDSLSRDPVMTAKVLRLANSAFFGGHRSMASIDAAIAMIGTEALARLIIACGVSTAFRRVPGIDLQVFWQDSVVAAVAAAEFAGRIDADSETAYTCGLLHAVGHLILCQTYPDIAQAMFDGFEVVRGAELAAIESGAFGIDHPEVGALWAETLGFPVSVIDAIRNTTQAPARSEKPLSAVLRNACSLTASIAAGKSAAEAVEALSTRIFERCVDANKDAEPSFLSFYAALRETWLAATPDFAIGS